MIKKGKLSDSEKKFIEENVDNLSVKEIALQLGRKNTTIKYYILENLKDRVVHQLEVDKDFKKSPEWLQISVEFSKQEVEFFEHRFVKYMTQFKSDEITTTEETQIFHLIKYEIHMHRNLLGRQEIAEAINRIEVVVKNIYKSCNRDLSKLSNDDKDKVTRFEETLSSLRASASNSVREYKDLQNQHAKILGELKATRDQRLERVASNKQTFVELIRDLQDKEVMEREGRNMKLLEIATEKEKERLSNSYVFPDGIPDQPILNADTI